MGFLYSWAAPRFYGADREAGFKLGLLHGAVMPAAFPGLLAGKDVPIYAPRNSGKLYNMGYVSGVNLCGAVFFGFAFLRREPGKRRPASNAPG